jgi:hypothetical protein
MSWRGALLFVLGGVVTGGLAALGVLVHYASRIEW